MKLAKRDREKIQSEGWEQPDGYWIYLKDGWQRCAESQEHSIAEDTKTEAYNALRAAVPCNCRECVDPAFMRKKK